MKNREHERAIRAHECVSWVDQNAESREKSNYRALVQAAGTLIHRAGLFQTLAFYLSKKDSHHKTLARHILRWILEKNDQEADALYFENLLCIDDDQACYYTAEAQAFVVWLKRFAAAKLPSRKQEQTDSTGEEP